MAAVRTVAQLRAAVANLPDDMPVKVFSDWLDRIVDADWSVHTTCDKGIKRQVFEVYVEDDGGNYDD